MKWLLFILLILIVGCYAAPPSVPEIKVPQPDEVHTADSIFILNEKPLGLYC